MNFKTELKETNLKEVKDTTKTLFLSVPVTPHKEFGVLVATHPFTSTGVVPKVTSDGKVCNGFWHIAENKEDYEAWKCWCFNMIDKAKDIYGLCAQINKPWRLTFLKFNRNHIDPDTFSALLSSCWVESENPNDDKNVSIRTLTSWFKKANKRVLMTEEDYAVWEALPSEFEVYRGVCKGHVDYGMSWTRNLKTARWFADRWNSHGYILKATIKKEHALAYFNTRNEDEILVDVLAIKNDIVRMEGDEP